MVVDDAETLAELEAMFAAYERALVGNDVAALDGFFIDSREGIRYGATENLYGIEEIRALNKKEWTIPFFFFFYKTKKFE